MWIYCNLADTVVNGMGLAMSISIEHGNGRKGLCLVEALNDMAAYQHLWFGFLLNHNSY